MTLMVCVYFVLVDIRVDMPSFLSVLTKVAVYAGIGTIATVLVPAMFEALEWGV
jgi:hypothetical protein